MPLEGPGTQQPQHQVKQTLESRLWRLESSNVPLAKNVVGGSWFGSPATIAYVARAKAGCASAGSIWLASSNNTTSNIPIFLGSSSLTESGLASQHGFSASKTSDAFGSEAPERQFAALSIGFAPNQIFLIRMFVHRGNRAFGVRAPYSFNG